MRKNATTTAPHRLPRLTARLIGQVSTATGEPQADVLARLCAQLARHYGVDLAACPHSSDESLVTVADRYGWSGELYAFARAELLYLQAEAQA